MEGALLVGKILFRARQPLLASQHQRSGRLVRRGCGHVAGMPACRSATYAKEPRPCKLAQIHDRLRWQAW